MGRQPRHLVEGSEENMCEVIELLMDIPHARLFTSLLDV